MKVVLVKGISQESFVDVVTKLKTSLKFNSQNVIFASSEPSMDVEIYDTETKRTIRGAEALAELLKDPYDTED